MTYTAVVVYLVDAEPATFSNARIETTEIGVIVKQSTSHTFFPTRRILSITGELPTKPPRTIRSNSTNIGGWGV